MKEDRFYAEFRDDGLAAVRHWSVWLVVDGVTFGYSLDQGIDERRFPDSMSKKSEAGDQLMSALVFQELLPTTHAKLVARGWLPVLRAPSSPA